ncbi:MAG TPA: hypothetical protein VGT44_19905, partial [Ktedonobacteraceae bacterium]|nr:hypothetical protein [Ktedonobacteraceae bacterium]
DVTSQVRYVAVTTYAVGSDRVIHFAVGDKSYSFSISSTTNLSSFGGNPQTIQSGTSVIVTVQYNGNSATVLSISHSIHPI